MMTNFLKNGVCSFFIAYGEEKDEDTVSPVEKLYLLDASFAILYIF